MRELARGSRGAGLAAAALAILLVVASSARAAPDLAGALRTFAQENPDATAAIGRQIRENETGGRDAWLITWLAGESHLSLGIGHFIWYPEDRTGPYYESFAGFLRYFQDQGGEMPAWLTPETPCPWASRADFRAANNDPRLGDLRRLIARTIDAQTGYLIERLARALPALLEATPEGERPAIERRLEGLLRPTGQIDPDGVYPLVDYANFKGEGLVPGERYQGQGWGLLQVLQGMDETDRPQAELLAAFARSATRTLERRVALSPPERHEARWLPGWQARVATYAHGLAK